MKNPREYYKSNGPMTAAGSDAAQLSALPHDIETLCEIVQGVLIHQDVASLAYGVAVSPEQSRERPDSHIRPIAGMLARIRTIDAQPLTVARAPAQRMACVCRHFTLMLCAILRAQGVPARARCGFGAYFNPGKFEDHWVAEYWDAAQARWILVDA